MKLVLASYFEPENHGTGRKVGISPSKPRNKEIECDLRFEPLDPKELYWEYHKMKRDEPKLAGDLFTKSYHEQCQEFVQAVKEEANKTGRSPLEILPFQDGDTLLSWERKGHTSYRDIVAQYLRELGYEVEES